MGFKKILDRIEDKIEEYEDEMDEDEVPPWYGSGNDEQTDESSGDDMTSVGSFNLDEGDDEVTIRILLPGVPEDNIEVSLEETGALRIDVEESETVGERNYEYNLPDNAVLDSIDADYDQGLLLITVSRD